MLSGRVKIGGQNRSSYPLMPTMGVHPRFPQGNRTAKSNQFNVA